MGCDAVQCCRRVASAMKLETCTDGNCPHDYTALHLLSILRIPRRQNPRSYKDPVIEQILVVKFDFCEVDIFCSVKMR